MAHMQKYSVVILRFSYAGIRLIGLYVDGVDKPKA